MSEKDIIIDESDFFHGMILSWSIWKMKIKKGRISPAPGLIYINYLEQAAHLAGINIYVNSSKGRVGTRPGHQTDRSGARAEELCPGVY
jgi:hypothetical protein